MTHAVVGIDVSKATLDIALRVEKGYLNKQVENNLSGYNQLVDWLKKQGVHQAHVCLEATGQYGDGVSRYLFEQGLQVSVVNPARIKYYGSSKLRRNKTDKADAQLIAEYCEREKPALWTPPAASFTDLQALGRHLDDLQVTVQQQKNRLGSGVHTPEVVASLHALISFLNIQINQTKAAIQRLVDSNPTLKHMQQLLVTIPGIAELTAARLLGEIRDILCFDSARQLAAYAGVTPRAILSGTSVHKKSRISKTGNSNLRHILYMPALSAKRWNPIIRDFCAGLLKSGHRPKELIVAAMRKLLHQVYGILKSDRPFDPAYLAKQQALA